MSRTKIKIARGPVRWLMKFNGLLIRRKVTGWTSFWNTIYVRDKKDLNNKKLIRHEMQHIKQIKKDGIPLFTIKYLYYSVRHGYWNNPYEVEARKVM